MKGTRGTRGRIDEILINHPTTQSGTSRPPPHPGGKKARPGRFGRWWLSRRPALDGAGGHGNGPPAAVPTVARPSWASRASGR